MAPLHANGGSREEPLQTSKRRLARFPFTLLIVSVFIVGPSYVFVSALMHKSTPGGPAAYPDLLIPSGGVYLGAFTAPRGDEDAKAAVLRLEAQIGRELAIDHQYYKWDDAIPTTHQEWDASTGRLPFLNWKAETAAGTPVRWSAIADGSQDDWIIERADAFKAFGSPVYLTFHHEPEDDLATLGSPSDYADAFRHIVDVFRSREVTNVAFVWTMMNWTFDRRSGRDPSAYYPGDGYVDIIGMDGYNWYPGRTGSRWETFREVFQHCNDFAVAHSKPWMVVEFGVQEDPDDPDRKARWFGDVESTVKTWPLLKALIYFDASKEFEWQVDSSDASEDAFVRLVHEPPMTASPSTASSSAGALHESLDRGPQGARIQAGPGGAEVSDDPFSRVVATAGSTLVYDDAHALGEFSARHEVTSGGNAYYQWTGHRTDWYGRLYVWLDEWPSDGLRLVRGSTNDVLRCALDILPDGTLRWVDEHNKQIAATTRPIAVQDWARIEWRVDHTTGRATIQLFNSSDSLTATQAVASSEDRPIGASAREIQFGRSGTQPFAFTFWTDEPALSSAGYIRTR